MQSAVIDTFIGVAFMFFLVAVFTSALVEVIGGIFKKRAKYLLRSLRDILDAPDDPANAAAGPAEPARNGFQTTYYSLLSSAAPKTVAAADTEKLLYDNALAAAGPADQESMLNQLMGHPLVLPFKQTDAAGKATRNPSYLPAATFAAALLDLLVPGRGGKTTLSAIKAKVDALDDAVPFKRALLALIASAEGDVDAFRSGLEAWYDAQMDRVSGAYKRWAKRWVIVFGLLAAVALNVNALTVAHGLYTDAPLRDAALAAATAEDICAADGLSVDGLRDLPPASGDPGEAVLLAPQADGSQRCVQDELEALRDDGLPLGWPMDDQPNAAWGWIALLFGWAITAFGASFGAPFWFDTLNRVGSLRNTGAKPKTAG